MYVAVSKARGGGELEHGVGNTRAPNPLYKTLMCTCACTCVSMSYMYPSDNIKIDCT